MPEQVIKKLKKNILPQWKISFFSALIMGLVAHMFKITSWLPNWDSLVFRYDSQNMIAMGRWFLPVACSPSSFYDLPWITGLLAIIFHAIGAVIICKMFGVKKNITAGLIGALVATFPTVTSVMMYNYVADGYALAFLLSCIAAMLLVKKNPNYITAAVLIAFSTGIYQAYITVTIMLLLLHLILELLYREDVKKSILKSVKFLIAGALGMALYYLLLTVIRMITNTQLLDYQGFGDATSLNGLNILESLYWIKELFISYFFDFSNGINAFGVINCIVFAVTVFLYLADIIKNKLSVSKIVLLMAYVALLPVGASVLTFINSGIDYHNLMKMGYLVYYLFLVFQYEKVSSSAIKSWTIFGVTSVLVFNYVIIANVGYHKLNMAYEKSYGTLIRIADRIEQTVGADKCDSIVIEDAIADSEDYSVKLPLDLTGATDGYILRADDEIVGQSVLCSALNDYCGKNYKFLSGEEKKEILSKIDDGALGVWPEKDSITVIGNTIVIKMGDKR